MATKRFDELDGEPESFARALALESKGRRSRRRRRRGAPAPSRTRWWLSSATAGGGGPAAREATLPAPPDEASELTLAEFIDGM
jgi:hypothetical protein